MKVLNMNPSGKAIVFDLDKTLVECDLPVATVREYYNNLPDKSRLLRIFGHLISKIPFFMLRRKLEYFELFWMPDYVTEKIMLTIFSERANDKTCSLLRQYLSEGYNVYIVTAGPQEKLAPIARALNANLIGSSIVAGVIIKDIQGKKELAYRKIISENMMIDAIYSDQNCDLSSLARRNYLIDTSGTPHHVFI